MPSQIVVVKRSQRDAFAAPRSAPAWLGALWTGLRRASRVRLDPAGLGGRSIAPVRWPRLVRDERNRHRCIGCELCVELCPSRSLSLDLRDSNEAFGIERFELDAGRCIGCGLCGEACPENAIELCATTTAAASSGSALPLRIDLLAQRA